MSPRKPEPELKLLAAAAAEAGIGVATIYRWLAAGFLTRYQTPKGMRRKTMVDMRELRALREKPPAVRVDPKPDAPAGEA